MKFQLFIESKKQRIFFNKEKQDYLVSSIFNHTKIPKSLSSSRNKIFSGSGSEKSHGSSALFYFESKLLQLYTYSTNMCSIWIFSSFLLFFITRVDFSVNYKF